MISLEYVLLGMEEIEVEEFNTISELLIFMTDWRDYFHWCGVPKIGGKYLA